MPQLDLYSYFSAATSLIVLFLTLVFLLHTYFLPKLATCLKFRKKMQLKQEAKTAEIKEKSKVVEEPFLEIAQNYIIELEKIIKTTAVK